MEDAASIQRLGTTDPRMSAVVIHNKILYISGQVDFTKSDVTSQTTGILEKIEKLLAQGGTDKSKLLTAQIWIKDIASDFKAMNEVWNKWIGPDNKPVRAAVEANMARPEILVEIQVTAAV